MSIAEIASPGAEGELGLGGERGAPWVHSLGYKSLADRGKALGEAAIQMLPIVFGLAVIEGHSTNPFESRLNPAVRYHPANRPCSKRRASLFSNYP